MEKNSFARPRYPGKSAEFVAEFACQSMVASDILRWVGNDESGISSWKNGKLKETLKI